MRELPDDEAVLREYYERNVLFKRDGEFLSWVSAVMGFPGRHPLKQEALRYGKAKGLTPATDWSP
jgi:hypothetical protein